MHLLGLAELANELQRTHEAVARAHELFLEGVWPGLGTPSTTTTTTTTPTPTPVPVPSPPAAAPAPAPPPVRRRPAAEIDLIAHAGGTLADAFGADWADLDRYEPRVRMPMPPLLLCHRVVEIEGERGQFGPARIVTEYDIPTDAAWTSSGRPPPCVMVESGQADLLLVSYLGIDAENRGERVYRLLDCDLTFHGPLPDPGETLRHDIRIDRFARLGATTLFYFHYDCISTTEGRPVLSMRNGCAGFFTPAELSTPRGVLAPPADVPEQTPLPLPAVLPETLDAAAVAALADASTSTLTLPTDPKWRLVHRVTKLATHGGPHGLGEVVYEQDLRDDDWFNPDPLPGRPVHAGHADVRRLPPRRCSSGCSPTGSRPTSGPTPSFEPLPRTLPTKLRCRGQVVPGQSPARSTTARIYAGRRWSDDALRHRGRHPAHGRRHRRWCIAHDVGVRVRGDPGGSRPPVQIDNPDVVAFSVGSAAHRLRASVYAPYDGAHPLRRACPARPVPAR